MVKYDILLAISVEELGSSRRGGSPSHGWGTPQPFLYRHKTQNKILSIFVDESGRFQLPDDVARFYIVGLVLHDQQESISKAVDNLTRD